MVGYDGVARVVIDTVKYELGILYKELKGSISGNDFVDHSQVVDIVDASTGLLVRNGENETSRSVDSNIKRLDEILGAYA
jgi:hypothetical protein|tara:strand:- start:66 stop:305 length:240 start_codon:yes stop_codon:yes gene_type:complete